MSSRSPACGELHRRLLAVLLAVGVIFDPVIASAMGSPSASSPEPAEPAPARDMPPAVGAAPSDPDPEPAPDPSPSDESQDPRAPSAPEEVVPEDIAPAASGNEDGGGDETRATGPLSVPTAGEEIDLADPLAPVDAALDRLLEAGMRVDDRKRVTDPLRGEALVATLAGEHFDLVTFVLERVAVDGYQITLEPIARDQARMVARPARADQERGLVFVQLQKLTLGGKFLRGESPDKLGDMLELSSERNTIWAADVSTELRMLGYEGVFRPHDAGHLALTVGPGRFIRRIRLRGHVPLRKRTVRRELSLDARPGALARGQCVHPRLLRQKNKPAVCAENDLPCREWLRTEKERLESFLFDEGYLRGSVEFGLSCGRAPDEADLWVFLHKGPPYRIGRKDIAVRGNVSSSDARWIRRIFRPTVSPILPLPKRVTREHVQQAKERVEREYALPKTSGVGVGSRKELQYPYPGVRVETSYDELDPKHPPSGSRLPLEVSVQLGRGVKTSFIGNESIPDNRLLNQVQIFQRREPPTIAAAHREAENLRNYYQSRGFLLATVDGRVPDFGRAGLAELVFAIAEGPRTRIRDIDTPRPPSIPKAVFDRIERKFGRDRELKTVGRFTDAQARKDLGTLLSALQDEGYLCARARVRVGFWKTGLQQAGAYAVLALDTELAEPGEPTWIEAQLDPAGLAALKRRRRAPVYVRYEIEPGPRLLTSGRETVRYLEQAIPPSGDVDGLPSTSQGAWGAPRMMRDGPLRRRGDERASGIPIRPGLDGDTERHVERLYRSSGYPVADAEMRWAYRRTDGSIARVPVADRLVSEEVGLCADHAGSEIATVDSELYVYEGKRGVFGNTLLRGNFKTRDWVLRREIDWDEGETYDVRKVDRTARRIDGTEVAELVTIEPKPVDCHIGDPGDCRVHEIVTISEAKDISVRPSFGVGLTTLDPLYAFVRPAFPNMFGTGWDLTLEGHWGFNPPGLREAICDGEDCFERSARATLSRPRILASPLTFTLGASIQQRVTPARGEIDSALTDVRLTWPINDHWQVYGGYLFQIANISKDVVKSTGTSGCGPAGTEPCTVVSRREAIVPDRTGAFQTGAFWNRSDNAFNPHEGFLASADFMLATPWLGGWDWWMRFDFLWQHFIPIPRTNKRLSFWYSLRYGHIVPLPTAPASDTTSAPEIWRYFGGGTVELGLRGIAPQTMLVDIERIEDQFGVVRLRPSAIGSHIRLLGTIALQVISVRDFFGGNLAHSLFLDFGILTQRWEHVRFNRDFRRSIGVNFLKWDVEIVTIALGYAVLIPDAIWPGGNVRPTDDRNGRFVFNVGVTF